VADQGSSNGSEFFKKDGGLAMSIITPTREYIAKIESTGLTQEPKQLSVTYRHRPAEATSVVWQQVDDILRHSLESLGFKQPDNLVTREQNIVPKPIDMVVVAPGIILCASEYKERFGGIELDEYRKRMSPEVFEVFVRYIGSIPGRSTLDVGTITAIPE
jgi:hypothetical protein